MRGMQKMIEYLKTMEDLAIAALGAFCLLALTLSAIALAPIIVPIHLLRKLRNQTNESFHAEHRGF